jgi:hypothetical protein
MTIDARWGLVLAACTLLACGDETSDWPESIERTHPWPSFGTGVDGLVTAPVWRRPVEFGCEQEQRVKREPARDFEPGEGPRKAVVETLGTTCRPPGSLLEATDEPAGTPLLVGSCAGGFRMAARGEDIASITFDDPDECPVFSSLRDDAAATRSRVTTKLRLITVSPPVLAFVSAEATAAGNLEVVDSP